MQNKSRPRTDKEQIAGKGHAGTREREKQNGDEQKMQWKKLEAARDSC